MLRKLALSLAVSAALGASQVNALGLGEIQVNSALNEPLDAEIKLTQVRDLSPLQIQPRMASLDEYATVSGGGQARYLRDIQFQVLVSPEGTGRIRLKSTEPVQEPFLNFMVEVNWPSGRLVREYTLLLDPPVFEPSPVGQQFTSTQTRSLAPAKQLRASRPAAPVSNIRTRANTETQVYVGVNDTLWEIAKRVKQQGVTEHQMMLALLRKNPQAFPTGNINNLKAGTVMDIPSAAEAQQLTHRESVAEVARQMQMWREGRASTKTPTKAPLDVSKTTGESPAEQAVPAVESAAATAAEEGKLTVLAPPEESAEAEQLSSATSSVDSDTQDGAEAGEASGEQVISAAAERLEDEVLIAQEKIDRLERDNADLNTKLNSVLEQLESQTRLLELQAQQMSTLQTELSKPQVAPADTPTSAEKASLLDNPAMLGGLGAGAIALLGGLWLLLRRKRSGGEGKRELVNVPDDLRAADRDAVPDMASAGAGMAAAAVAGGAAVMAADEADAAEEAAKTADESEFVRPPMESLAPDDGDIAVEDLDQDLQELDLDMDLDLDDLDAPQDDDVLDGIDSAEFDLGLDEEPMVGLAAAEELAAGAVASDDAESLDVSDEADALAFTLDQPEVEEEPSELDTMLADQDVDEDLDFLLGDSVTSQDASSDDEELLDLDFDLGGDSSVDEALDFTSATASSAGETESELDNSLHETVEAASEVEFEIDPALEAMLQGSDDQPEAASDDGLEFDLGFADDAQAADAFGSAEDDLESLLTSFDPELAVESAGQVTAMTSEAAEQELTANISHDLEMDLDSEVDELLGSTDDDIELEEQRNDEQDEVLDRMNLLSDADEIETKLDLARAYIEMEDSEGARDILNEITSEGSNTQREEAQKLLETLA